MMSNIFTFNFLVIVVIAGLTIDLSEAREDCDRDEIIYKFRRACVTYKRSANFFQPMSSRLNLAPESEEVDEPELSRFLLPPQGRFIRDYNSGEQSGSMLIEDYEPSSDSTKTDKLTKSGYYGTKTRRPRFARLFNELISKCCNTEEGCTMRDFIIFEDKTRYCDAA